MRPFLDNIERFGLLPDAKNAGNPYGLPVGISFAPSKLTGIQMIGLNCSACHVGQVQYQNHAVRIDGAANMAYINKFLEHMASETEATFTSPQRLARFWDRVRAVRRERRATAQRDPATSPTTRRWHAASPTCSRATAACWRPRSGPCATCRR